MDSSSLACTQNVYSASDGWRSSCGHDGLYRSRQTVRPMLGRQSSWDAQGLTMSIYKNCPIWLNIWTAAAYIARLARSIKWVNQYMISCSISNFKSNADNEDHLKSLSVFFFTCTPLIRNEYLFYGNKGLKLPSDLAILSTFGRLQWLHHSLRQMRFIKVIYIWYVRV